MSRSTRSAGGFRQSWRRTAVELGALACAVLLLYAGLRSAAGWLADGAVAGLPASVDRLVGDAGARSVRAQYALAGEPTEQQRTRVERVFQELRRALAPDEATALAEPRATVLADDQVNAFALPGGELFVLTGLLDRIGDDDELLRGVLAHELGHAVRRHGLKSLARSAATAMAVSWLLGDLDGMTATLVSGASELDRLAYSRGMEAEADQFAVSLLARSGHSADGLARFLEGLERAPVPALLSTHPDSRERARALRAGTLKPE